MHHIENPEIFSGFFLIFLSIFKRKPTKKALNNQRFLLSLFTFIPFIIPGTGFIKKGREISQPLYFYTTP